MGASDKELEEEKTGKLYVVDASALYPLLLRTNVEHIAKMLPNLRILDLNKYEVGTLRDTIGKCKE